MAKKQTFTSKLSKQESNFKHVKHIKSVISEESGHVKFLENMVRLEENENLDQALKRMEEEAKQVLSFGEALEKAPVEEQPKEGAPVEKALSEESKKEAPAEESSEEAPAEEQPKKEAPEEEASAEESKEEAPAEESSEEAEPASEDKSAEQAEESSKK